MRPKRKILLRISAISRKNPEPSKRVGEGGSPADECGGNREVQRKSHQRHPDRVRSGQGGRQTGGGPESQGSGN